MSSGYPPRPCRLCGKPCYCKPRGQCTDCRKSMRLNKGSNSRVNRTRRYRRNNGLKVGDVDGL